MSSTLFLRSAGLIALMIALQLTQVVSATEAKKPNRRCINVGENLEGSRGVDELTAMVVDSFRKSDFRGLRAMPPTGEICPASGRMGAHD